MNTPKTAIEQGVALTDLAGRPIYVAWREESVNGRSTKVPKDPARDRNASSTDSKTWGTRKAAERRAQRLGKGAGVGIMLGDHGDGWRRVGFDLDGALTELGIPKPWAQDVLDRVPGYVDVSPSGSGLHIYGFAREEHLKELLAEELLNGMGSHEFEMGPHLGPAFYSAARFFTLSGVTYRDGPLLPIDMATLRWFLAELGPSLLATAPKASGGRADTSRSADAYVMATNLARAGKSEEEVRKALAEDSGRVGEWVAERPAREVERTIRNAVAKGQSEREDVGRMLTDADVPGGGMDSEALALIWGDDEPDWGGPITFGNGELVNNLSNTILVLGRHIESILPGLRFNELAHEMEWAGGIVDDAALSLAQVGIEKAALNKATKQNVIDALAAVAKRFGYHPIRDYLTGLRWDGRRRADDWLIRIVGTPDTPYARAVGRKMLIAMVARMMKPGCKFDHMVVFHGAQDQGKSTLGEVLAGEGYFSDTLPSIHDKKEAMRHLVGLWLVEMAELAPSRKADQEDQKAFLSGKIDRVRFPHAKFYVNVPRTCIFIGTSNEDEFLKDPTGGRRFWPIKVPGLINIRQLRAERDQLFAEAMAAFEAGESWWMDRDFEVAHARPVQEAAREIDPWVEKVRRYVDDDRFDRDVVRIADVLTDALELKPVNHTMSNSKRAGAALKSLGFEKTHTREGNVWMRDANGLL